MIKDNNKIAEVMCIACKRRWIAKFKHNIPLRNFDCPYCLYPKGIIFTGESNKNIDMDNAIEMKIGVQSPSSTK